MVYLYSFPLEFQVDSSATCGPCPQDAIPKDKVAPKDVRPSLSSREKWREKRGSLDARLRSI